MSKVLSVLFIIVASFSIAISQEPSRNNDTLPSHGIAPKVPNGIGRADVRVFDEKGNTRTASSRYRQSTWAV